MVKVVDTEARWFSHYMTLSHCWGNSVDMIKTTKRNLASQKISIGWNDLPQVFKDAIELARSLDCQWIWIDSLCIIQNDENDWKGESAKMAEIYSNSLLNIAATSSSTSSRSLFTHRRHPGDLADNYEDWSLEPFKLVEGPNGGASEVYVRVSHSRGHDFLAEQVINRRDEHVPLLGRAWVFQERILSPRTVHFGKSEMLWECNSTFACECTQIAAFTPVKNLQRTGTSLLCENKNPGTKSDKSMGGLKAWFADIVQNRASREETLDFWLQAVQFYSTLSLTKPFDRPYALAGIASRIHDILGSTYLAGIWMVDLPRALIWTVKPRCRSGTERISQKAPTWSWTSQYHPLDRDCSVNYYGAENFIRDVRLYVHESGTFCNYAGESLFGSALSGQIEISAALLHGRIVCNDDVQPFDRFCVDIFPTPGRLYTDCWEADELTDNEDVVCLLVGTSRRYWNYENLEQILVLRAVSNSTVYKRIGITESCLVDVDDSRFKHAKAERIIII
jgi:hypothetical protein